MELAFCSLVLFFLAAEAADISDLVVGNKKFTGDLYSDTPTWNRDIDILLSPFSVQTVLAMTQSGAKGVTAEEIRTGAGLPATSEDTEAAILSALETIEGKIVNKVYVENGFTTNEDYKTLASNIYKSTFEDIEFISSAAAAKTINEWGGQQTNSQFGNYFAKAADYNNLSKDLLINVLNLLRQWTLPFDPSQTIAATFAASNYTSYTVQMMTQGPNLYNYYESEELDAKFLEMPLGEDTTITMVVPNAVTGISNIEKNVHLALTTPAYTQEHVQVSLPRIAIQATYLPLQSSIIKLGVNAAFHNDNADLSGISGVPGEIAAYNLIHNTHLTIDETGLQTIAGGLLQVRVPSTKHFLVDKAFFFYIKVNGIIVLVGRVLNPNYVIHH